MESISDFFGDPLVWPVIVYIVSYTFAWLIALGIVQFLKHSNSIERAAATAWSIGFLIHIIGGTALIIWLWDRTHNRFSDGLYTFLYLLLYIVIIIVDIILILSILSKKSKQRNVNASTLKPARKSLNPKNKQ